ncbi:MAG: hypothetical protein K2W99_02110 [Chthoniobacterales bacterium]|nr:hypothetical protein [Chthoniobacterales bacterium]
MTVLVTCGPSSEPIDRVRSLTNFSTGELGAILCESLCQAGFKVICLRSRTATFPIDEQKIKMLPFRTNADLSAVFQKVAREQKIVALFHTAALCDYRVSEVSTLEGKLLDAGKIGTGYGPITMTLQPTEKIIAHLRAWFPTTKLVGWKYEVDGTKMESCSKASHQIEKYQLDASVANGPAVGEGFEVMGLNGSLGFYDSKKALAAFLAQWVKSS